MTSTMFGVRVEIVPDDNQEAGDRIPPEILMRLGQTDVLMSRDMLYVRKTHWDKIMHHFAPKDSS